MDDDAVVLGSFVTELPNGAAGSAKAGFVTAGDDAAKFLAPWRGLLSPVPELAQHAGTTFEELVRWMVEDASLDR